MSNTPDCYKIMMNDHHKNNEGEDFFGIFLNRNVTTIHMILKHNVPKEIKRTGELF